MVMIPEPQETDSEDVTLSLDVARTQWNRGDQQEALKWLRKAADAAFDADEDARGMELSKVAADIKAALDAGGVASPSPSHAPPPAAPAQPVQQRPVVPAPQGGVPMPGHSPAPPKTAPAAAKPLVPPPGAVGAPGTKKRGSIPAPRPSSRPVPGPGSVVPSPNQHARPATPKKKPSIPAPSQAEDEATREYVLPGKPGSAMEAQSGVSDVNWPTETSIELDDTELNASNSSRSSAESASKTKARRKKSKLSMVPSTSAIRVAAKRSPSGEVVVRLLDSSGIRPGEHDTMLVALTSTEDLRKLFES